MKNPLSQIRLTPEARRWCRALAGVELGDRSLRQAVATSAGVVTRPAIILAALALSGCATTKYVTRSCITKAQLADIESQAPPKVRDQLNGNAEHDVKILAANIVRLRAYEDLLDGTLRICAS